ncbi:hypothetical protein ACFXP3_19995 [Streptomyces sp. NPDC059096]|uniref:hypothetical protein n=1 Tax=Streptomyces sp. NPDC059096 TaxID=3346727 RepID=UPI0036816D17
MKFISVVAAVVLFAISLGVFFVLRALLLVFLERLRLKLHGENVEGACAGYSSGRYGNGVEIDFTDRDGGSHQMVSHSWRGRLPELGERVTVVYLPRDPTVSDVSPIRSLIPNAIYMAVAIPVLAAVGISGIVLAVYLVRNAWF